MDEIYERLAECLHALQLHGAKVCMSLTAEPERDAIAEQATAMKGRYIKVLRPGQRLDIEISIERPADLARSMNGEDPVSDEDAR